MNDVNYRTGIGFLLSTLGRKTEALWGGFLKEQGITTAELTALSVLYGKRACVQKQLAAEIEVDPRNVVAIVSKLKGRAWVEFSNDEQDGRAKVISITLSGDAAVRRLYDQLRPIDEEFFKNITNAERNQLKELLNKLKAD